MRPATSADEPFLREMLAVAAGWRGDPAGPDPGLEHYVEGFGRDGDVGVVAELGDTPVGAVWARRFEAAHPGYGFVAEDVPELSIGVRAGHRGQGLGSALLEALVRALAGAGAERVSLSVEPDNPARRLYERAGFAKVGENGGSWTMVRRLR
jgi:ribosomal protein S18 acetylase RimI-like enzyme